MAMARAVLRDAPLVLLDEPTAGLDLETERDLLARVVKMAERSIVIIVSHRPAALAIADHIVRVSSTADSTAGVLT